MGLFCGNLPGEAHPCDGGNCLPTLQMQLAVVFTGKTIGKQVIDITSSRPPSNLFSCYLSTCISSPPAMLVGVMIVGYPTSAPEQSVAARFCLPLKALPLRCVPAAFAAKTPPLRCVFLLPSRRSRTQSSRSSSSGRTSWFSTARQLVGA